jgi:enamine deaminase RidA (YjgF/YER057c/UK114 family)
MDGTGRSARPGSASGDGSSARGKDPFRTGASERIPGIRFRAWGAGTRRISSSAIRTDAEEVTPEEAQRSGRLGTLAILASLKVMVGDLDRIVAWNVVNGHINADVGYRPTTAVINPASELIIDLFGADIGAHARTAIGVSALPLNLPVVISAEIEISPK